MRCSGAQNGRKIRRADRQGYMQVTRTVHPSKFAINPYGAVGFGLVSIFAVAQGWSLPEFCWGVWLAGLVYSWACVAAAAISIILSARSTKPAYDARMPFLQRLSPNAFLLVMTAVGIAAGLIGFHLYAALFGFYGLFLSVFAEMAPLSLFGRNGFINSDFCTPLIYLLERFWPLAAAALIADWRDFFSKNPWKWIVLPFQSEILRIHIMVLALPFLSLLAWALFRGAYQPATIVLLLGIFFLLPKKRNKAKYPGSTPSDSAGQSDKAGMNR